jgi:DNA-directed RNA polymerase subunit RPC12/RpoP
MISAEKLACPGCSADLVVNSTGGYRRYGCSGCGAIVCGLAVLKHVTSEQVGKQIWANAMNSAEPEGGTGGYCPFCHNRMIASPVDAGRIGICRFCEMVFADRTAQQQMPASGAVTMLSDETVVQKCSNCGAVIDDTSGEKCSYCGALLQVREKVAVLPAPPVQRRPQTRGGKIARIAGEVIGGILESPF